ncbi:hypothetical protein BGZ96_003235, partial [Linnemannia gamsii]
MNAGIKVYTATLNNPADSNKERDLQFLQLKASFGNRAKDFTTRSQAELQSFQSNTTDPG